MDGLLRIGWIAVILIGFGPSAWGIDLFVSPDGADTQAGTADAPLLSVQTAIDCAAAVVKQSGYPSDGIRITIRSGHYSFDKPLTITLTHTNRITYPELKHLVLASNSLGLAMGGFV